MSQKVSLTYKVLTDVKGTTVDKNTVIKFSANFKTNTNNEILKKAKKELLERKNKLLL